MNSNLTLCADTVAVISNYGFLWRKEYFWEFGIHSKSGPSVVRTVL